MHGSKISRGHGHGKNCNSYSINWEIDYYFLSDEVKKEKMQLTNFSRS